MFEVGPNLWLQGFASPWLNLLMKLVSFFGYDWLYAATVIVLGFGWRLRPMLGVMLALLLASAGTHAIKDGFRLPRPVQVDARLLDKGFANQQWQTERGGAEGAFSLPSAVAIDAQRHADAPDYGFLSGHVAAATALCVSFLLWRPRRFWVRAALIAWPGLMALSRMYLGRHFLADVVAGALCGVLAAVLARRLWKLEPPRWLVPAAVVVALACLAWPPLARVPAGQLLGLAITGYAMHRAGWPVPRGGAWRGVARVALAFGVYALTKSLLAWVEHGVDGQGIAWAPTLSTAVATAVVFLGSALLCKRMGLYAMPGPGIAQRTATEAPR